MKAGIIAAGDGSRLEQAGIPVPKPLVELGGMTLLERTLRLLWENGIEEVAFIVNERMASIATHVNDLHPPIPVHPLVKTTESSMHSLHELSRLLGDDRFVLCTVDSIMVPQEASEFIRGFMARPEVDVLLSYTDFVDDEKPLRIGLDEDERVVSLGESASESPFVTVGLYGMSPSVMPLLESAVSRGMKKLRNFLGSVVESDAEVRGFRLSKAIDVDRPEDMEVARAFLLEHAPDGATRQQLI